MQDNIEQQTYLLKKYLFVSLGFHVVLVVVFSFSSIFSAYLYPKPQDQQQEAAVFMSLDIADEKSSQQKDKSSLGKNSKDKQELVVDPKSLPQLPNKFTIKEDQQKDVMSLVDKKVKKKPKIKKTKSLAPKLDKKTIKLTKEEAFKRLLKELAHKKKKHKKKAKPRIRLSDKLRKRSKKLSRTISGIELSGTTINSGYAQTLKAWVMKYYILPEAYDYSNIKQDAKLLVVLSAQGGIKSIKLLQSSANSYFDKIAMRILKQAAPFPPPPKDWVDKKITFPFSGASSSSKNL
jgi:periplasmic protein TonB